MELIKDLENVVFNYAGNPALDRCMKELKTKKLKTYHPLYISCCKCFWTKLTVDQDNDIQLVFGFKPPYKITSERGWEQVQPKYITRTKRSY